MGNNSSGSTYFEIGLERPVDSRYPNLCSVISQIKECGTSYLSCDFQNGYSGVVSISFADFSVDGLDGCRFIAEIFVEKEALLRTEFIVNADGTISPFLSGHGTDSYLEKLNSILAFARPFEGTYEEISIAVVEHLPSRIDGMAMCFSNKIDKILGAGEDEVELSSQSLRAHPNLVSILKAQRSRVIVDGEEWKVTAEESRGMVSITCTGPRCGLISFSVFNDEEGESVISDGASDFAIKARQFLDRISSITEGHY